MAAQHTPTPWTLQDNHLGTYRITAMQGPIKVCPCSSSSLDDAAFIVIAVNAHDDLVAALKLALPVLLTTDEDTAPRLQERIKAAQSALAKAEAL